MRYKLLILPSNFVAVADQGKEQDDSPVPQRKKYLEETHSSQSSSDMQMQPPGEPPPSERIKQGICMFQWSVSVHRKEAAPPTQYIVYWPAFIMQHTTIGTKVRDIYKL